MRTGEQTLRTNTAGPDNFINFDKSQNIQELTLSKPLKKLICKTRKSLYRSLIFTLYAPYFFLSLEVLSSGELLDKYIVIYLLYIDRLSSFS